jgi:hypothetical protein
VLESKFVHKALDVLGFRPNARHNEVAGRMVQGATPRTVIVVIDQIVGDGIDFGMLGDKLHIKGIDCRMWLNSAGVALA